MNENTCQKKKLIAYARVSTLDQHLENQLKSHRKYIKYNDQYEIVKVFKEKKSAFKERPKYKEAMLTLFPIDKLQINFPKEFKNVRNLEYKFDPEIDGIIIQRLDRIGRSVKQLSSLIDLFVDSGKIFIASEQNINLDTIEGKLLANILSAIAEFEAALFKERSREGRIRHREQGGAWGRPPIKIDTHLKRRIIKLSKSIGTPSISKILKSDNIDISPMTIYRRLKEWGEIE